MKVQGSCDDRFVGVKTAFEENFTERGDVGACVAVTYQGDYVVDLWGGYRDEARTRLWEENTIVNVYSSTKTMAAITALLLADRGEIDFYEPVKTYWPEFAQNGKDKIEVRHLMSHSAGLSGMDEPMVGEDIYDWDRMVEALARQAPWWEPGTASGYHALTQGHLIGEVVRRVTGQSIGNFFRTELAEPLEADFHIGIRAEHNDRIGELIPPEAGLAEMAQGGSIAARTFANPAIDALASRTDGWRQAEIPAANGHGNARSLVRSLVTFSVRNWQSPWKQTFTSALEPNTMTESANSFLRKPVWQKWRKAVRLPHGLSPIPPSMPWLHVPTVGDRLKFQPQTGTEMQGR